MLFKVYYIVVNWLIPGEEYLIGYCYPGIGLIKDIKVLKYNPANEYQIVKLIIQR